MGGGHTSVVSSLCWAFSSGIALLFTHTSLGHQVSGYIHLREASGKSVLIKPSLSASFHCVLLAHISPLSSRSQAKGPPLFSFHLRPHHFNFLSVHRPTANPASLSLALTLEEVGERGWSFTAFCSAASRNQLL